MKGLYKYGLGFMLAVLCLACTFHFIYPLLYAASSSHIKAEMIDKISSGKYENDETQIISLSETDVHKYYNTEENELTFNNNKYDVISIDIKNGIARFTVLYDVDETNLDNDYGNHTESKSVKLPVTWLACYIHNSLQVLKPGYTAIDKEIYPDIISRQDSDGFNTRYPKPPELKCYS